MIDRWLDEWIDGCGWVDRDKEVFYFCHCHLVPPKEADSLTTYFEHKGRLFGFHCLKPTYYMNILIPTWKNS